MTAKLVVLGSFNMDLLAYVPRFPRPGESILGARYLSTPGGKGSNQAVAAARLGADVSYVGRIGSDAFGEAALDQWGREQINTRYVVRDRKNATGVSLIYVAETTSDNMIACVPGANMALSRTDVDAAAEAIARAQVVLAQLENPLETTAYALRLGRMSGAMSILNPAPAAPVLPDLLASADFLTPNETELELLTGGTYDDPAVAARKLIVDERQTVIVTLGERGALIVTRDEEILSPAFRVKVVDTTGAGDAFSAALAVALAEGRETPEAVRFANAAAALCVTRPGTAQAMPTRTALDTFLAERR
jgi:ribokinase